MEFKISPSSCIVTASISREGRHISVFKQDYSLSVFRLSQPVSSENEFATPIVVCENVRSAVWHSDETKLLYSKRNGDLEFKSFQRNSPVSGARLTAEQLLKHLILKRLQFDSLKQILCLSFQREFCILQTSAKQIAGLHWKSNHETEIVWALEVGEFAVWNFFDRFFVNFEPHSKNLHIYNLFDGRIKKVVQLDFSGESSAVSRVRQVAACPNGKMFTILTDAQLLAGRQKLHILLSDGKSVSDVVLGTEHIAVLTRQPDEYLLFSISSMQQIYCCPIGHKEIIIFAQHFDRTDKCLGPDSIRDLQEATISDILVNVDVRESLLNTALSSQNLESAAQNLKIADTGNETEICRMLRVLDDYIQTSQSSSPTHFGLQIIGLALGFASRAFKKFPHCSIIFNLIFAWQNLLPLDQLQPSSLLGGDEVTALTEKLKLMNENEVVKYALLHNCLPAAQELLFNRGNRSFQDMAKIRQMIIDDIQNRIFILDETQSLDETDTMLMNLGCDVIETWEMMCLRAEDAALRTKFVDIICHRHVLSESLKSSLDFILFVERNVKDSNGCVPKLTLGVVSEWSCSQRRLYLAEAFLSNRSEEIAERIQPEDVWQVMLNKQIISSLRKWIENQLPTASKSDDIVIPYSWPISDSMLSMAFNCLNQETREVVLNLLANQGLFAQEERHDFVSFLKRLMKIGITNDWTNIIDVNHSNVSVSDILTAAVDFCATNFKPKLFYDLMPLLFESSVNLAELVSSNRPIWMKIISLFYSWIKTADLNTFVELSQLNVTLLQDETQNEEDVWMSHPFIVIFFHLMKFSNSCPIRKMDTVFKNIPLLVNASQQTSSGKESISYQQMLVDEIPIHSTEFFRWRQNFPINEDDFPHFSNSRLCSKYGIKIEQLDWTFYLQLCRPIKAFLNLKANGLVNKESAFYPFAIQALALEAHSTNRSLVQSCVLLIEMLGYDSYPLRLCIAALDTVRQSPDWNCKELANIGRNMLTDVRVVKHLKQMLQNILMQNCNSSDPNVSMMFDWIVVVDLCDLFGLEFPVDLCHQIASQNKWLLFLLFIQYHNYPLEQCHLMCQHFTSSFKLHIQLVLRNIVEQDTSKQLTSYSRLFDPKTSSESFYRILSGPSLSTKEPTLLHSALIHESIEMAVLTAVMQPENVFPSLCVYLYLQLSDKSITFGKNQSHKFSVRELDKFVFLAISSHQFQLVLEAFQIFVPRHLLTEIIIWIDLFSRSVTETSSMEHLHNSISNYEAENAGESLFFEGSEQEVFRLGLRFIKWTLRYVVLGLERQLELVSLCADAQLFDGMLINSLPDFSLIAAIISLCLDAGIDGIDVSNLMKGSGSLKFKTECQQAVEILLHLRLFEQALKLAHLGGLPADTIFVTQLASQLKSQSHLAETQTLRYRTMFWSRCDQLLRAHHVRPIIASTFFRDHLPGLTSWESHLITDYALAWLKQETSSLPTDHLSNEELDCKTSSLSNLQEELEMKWWSFRIEAELDGIVPPSLLELPTNTSSSVCPLLIAKVANPSLAIRPQQEQWGPFLDKVNQWVDKYLDAGDMSTACRLSSMFNQKSHDLLLLLFLIDVVENKIDLSQVNERLHHITQEKEALHLDWKDRMGVIEYVENMLKHGHGLCQRLSVCYQVAMILDLKYEYVAEHSQPVCVLKMLLETPNQSGLSPSITGHLNLARSWITVSHIGIIEVVELVKNELIEVARQAHCGQVNATETNMVVSLLRGQFNRLVTLCVDPTWTAMLGSRLLESALDLERKNEFPIAVEAVIFSHSCFTLISDVEKISQILNHTRSFISQLLAIGQFGLITRLLTGVQRYREMNYVFSLLKENDQFEFLLRKGMDRLPLLRQALLDFLRPNCASNRELFRLVGLHFHMHHEVAALWKEEAENLLKPIVSEALNSIVRTTRKGTGSSTSSNLSKNAESSPVKKTTTAGLADTTAANTIIPMLKTSVDLKKNLNLAMGNYVHAAEYFVQAGKLNHARECALQAELIALQIHLVNRSPGNTQIYCLIGLNAVQINQLISDYFTYPEAEIISRCYGIAVMWGRALVRHYVINGEDDFLIHFLHRHAVTSELVEEGIVAFESESSSIKKPEVLHRLSCFVSKLPDVEAKYRIASRLGLLRQLVGDILASSALPYLKDVAWGKKSNQN